MIALTAYGIRKAYKKQQAKKAQREQLERENRGDAAVARSDELQSANTSISHRQSPHLLQTSRRLVNSSSSSPVSPNQGETASASTYSASLYSQRSHQDPLEEMRQYQAYIQRQSYDFGTDTNPPAYEFVVEQDSEASLTWKSGFHLPSEASSPGRIRKARHIPQGPNRVVELDSSPPASRDIAQPVPLRLFHPRSPVTSDNQVISPAIELPADSLDHIVPPTQDNHQLGSMDEQAAAIPLPLRIRKSKDYERVDLPGDGIAPTSSREDEAQEEEHTIDNERQHKKRPRSESGSEIESEDNEEVIVRINVADRTKRPFPKRVSVVG